MKKSKILFIIIQLWLITSCRAQPYRVIKSTSQHVAGGVVGNYGTNYHIELEANSKKTVPDTIWINGKVYPLNLSAKNSGIAASVDSITHKIRYSIWESDFHSGFNRHQNNTQSQNDTITKKNKPVRQFQGAAMVSYLLKGKEHFFIIQSFTLLPQLNYP